MSAVYWKTDDNQPAMHAWHWGTSAHLRCAGWPNIKRQGEQPVADPSAHHAQTRNAVSEPAAAHGAAIKEEK